MSGVILFFCSSSAIWFSLLLAACIPLQVMHFVGCIFSFIVTGSQVITGHFRRNYILSQNFYLCPYPCNRLYLQRVYFEITNVFDIRNFTDSFRGIKYHEVNIINFIFLLGLFKIAVLPQKPSNVFL